MQNTFFAWTEAQGHIWDEAWLLRGLAYLGAANGTSQTVQLLVSFLECLFPHCLGPQLPPPGAWNL